MKLAAALDKHQDAEFRYGVADCFLFACDVIRDVTGADYAEPWRGKYRSAHGALRAIAVHGDFVDAMCAVFGPVRPIFAVKKGDPVLVHRDLVESDAVAEALGIFNGDDITCLTDRGLITLPLTCGRGCWHV